MTPSGAFVAIRIGIRLGFALETMPTSSFYAKAKLPGRGREGQLLPPAHESGYFFLVVVIGGP